MQILGKLEDITAILTEQIDHPLPICRDSIQLYCIVIAVDLLQSEMMQWGVMKWKFLLLDATLASVLSAALTSSNGRSLPAVSSGSDRVVLARAPILTIRFVTTTYLSLESLIWGPGEMRWLLCKRCRGEVNLRVAFLVGKQVCEVASEITGWGDVQISQGR